MNRRDFIASLLATATLDPERLLWVPGQKKIFVPAPLKGVYFRYDAFTMAPLTLPPPPDTSYYMWATEEELERFIRPALKADMQ